MPRIYTRTPVEARFWKYVSKTDSCWLWTGATNTDGYGVIATYRGDGAKVYRRAHVISWEWANGPVPKGMSVCHNCPGGDNPACVNPDHLWLGTTRQNQADKARKGRAKGSNNGQSKLDEPKVAAIKAMLSENITRRAIAAEFGVTVSTIDHIATGLSWGHVKGPVD